jgi:hypothetical protein
MVEDIRAKDGTSRIQFGLTVKAQVRFPWVIQGVVFKDGIKQLQAAA